MASISRQPNGRRTIQYIGADGKRRSIRLGKISRRDAEAVKVKVERLNSAIVAGHTADDETLRWVTSLDEALYGKLAGAGLVPKRVTSTLIGFVDWYIAARSDVKRSTVTV